MDVTIKTMTIEDIERRRAEIKKIIQTPEFQEREGYSGCVPGHFREAI